MRFWSGLGDLTYAEIDTNKPAGLMGSTRSDKMGRHFVKWDCRVATQIPVAHPGRNSQPRLGFHQPRKPEVPLNNYVIIKSWY